MKKKRENALFFFVFPFPGIFYKNNIFCYLFISNILSLLGNQGEQRQQQQQRKQNQNQTKKSHSNTHKKKHREEKQKTKKRKPTCVFLFSFCFGDFLCLYFGAAHNNLSHLVHTRTELLKKQKE